MKAHLKIVIDGQHCNRQIQRRIVQDLVWHLLPYEALRPCLRPRYQLAPRAAGVRAARGRCCAGGVSVSGAGA